MPKNPIIKIPIKDKSYLKDFTFINSLLVKDNLNFSLFIILYNKEPNTFKDFITSIDNLAWIDTINKEFNSLLKQNT